MSEYIIPLITILGSAVAAFITTLPGIKAVRSQSNKNKIEVKQLEDEITERVLSRAKAHIDELTQELTRLEGIEERFDEMARNYSRLSDKYDRLEIEYHKVIKENVHLRSRVAELEIKLSQMKGN